MRLADTDNSVFDRVGALAVHLQLLFVEGMDYQQTFVLVRAQQKRFDRWRHEYRQNFFKCFSVL